MYGMHSFFSYGYMKVWWLRKSTFWTCFCTLTLAVSLFIRIGFIWVLVILDSALQINIYIKARSLYFHIVPALRLHLWSLVLIIALPVIDPMWLVPFLTHLKRDCSMVYTTGFQQIVEQFLFEQASKLDRKYSSKKVLLRLSYPLLVICGWYVKDPHGKAQK